MAERWVTYDALAALLDTTPEAARQLANRLKFRKQQSNQPRDRRVRVLISDQVVAEHKRPDTTRTPPVHHRDESGGYHPDIATRDEIQFLRTELASRDEWHQAELVRLESLWRARLEDLTAAQAKAEERHRQEITRLEA